MRARALLALAALAAAAAQTPCAPGTFGAGGLAPCSACAAGAWSFGSSAACATTCPAGTAFVSASAGCAPTSAAGGPIDSLAFYFSGAQAEGVDAFSSASATAGVSYTVDRLGAANAALTLAASGAHLDTNGSATFPTGNAAMSLSAWLQCAPFTATSQASVIEWGAPAFATAVTKLGLSVNGSAPAAVPGPIAAACDNRWHHLAVVHGDGSATSTKQYLDGALVASNTASTLALAAASSSLRVGWNGNPPTAPVSVSFTAVGTSSWTVPAGVTSINVLVVGGGGGSGSSNAASGGGGGGGGGVCTTVSVTPGQVIPVSVGAGGTAPAKAAAAAGGLGGNSTFGALTALGGGGGGTWQVVAWPATSGATGGGAGYDTVTLSGEAGAAAAIISPVQGFAGGANYLSSTTLYGTGGGGGAGGPGLPGLSTNAGGAGGPGAQCLLIAGNTNFYGGGGGGTGYSTAGAGGSGGGGAGNILAAGTAGAANTGGGGGSGWKSAGTAGGAGVVIISYTPPATADLLSGSVSDLRLYSRALLASEVLALSQPPLSYPGVVAPTLTAGATSYSMTSCAAGYAGVVSLAWTTNVATNVWTQSGSNACAACAAGTFSSAGNATCTTCAAGSFSSAGSASCTPTCPANTFTVGQGCLACPTGASALVGTAAGQTACLCAPGYFWSSASSTCSACAAGAWSLGGSTACATTCPAGAAFASATQGCLPSAASGPTSGLAFYFSGSQAEGVAAFSQASSTAGVSFTSDRFGSANAALTLASGGHLDTAALSALPTGNAAMSLSAWLQCAPFTATSQASVIEWGAPAFATAVTKLGLSVNGSAPAAVPGPIAAACDNRWHHLAVVHGDGSATSTKQYLDGALVASNTASTLALAAASSSLRVGWNGNPPTAPVSVSFTAVGTSSWTVPAGVTSINVLVVGGGGGSGAAGAAASGGGGGGGGLICTSISVTPGQVIPISVGAGGAAGPKTAGASAGSLGGNSTFGALTALGGGGGGGWQTSASPATSGGSGGGAGYTTVTGTLGAAAALIVPAQGFAGGANWVSTTTSYGSGGGGGAGGPGLPGLSTSAGGAGGPGAQCLLIAGNTNCKSLAGAAIPLPGASPLTLHPTRS